MTGGKRAGAARRVVPRPVKRLAKKLLARSRTAKFWAKSGLYRFTPGGYGYYRKLRRYRRPDYVHERDKHPVRRKHHTTEGWKPESREGLRLRDYESYEEYRVHQEQKLEEILKMGGGFGNRGVYAHRLKFYRRFRHLIELLPRSAVIVCAGARTGTEVEVLRDLGFENAYGIDVNPGPDNPLVRPGDFHDLENETSSVDLVYSNSLDHAFDLEGFFAEHARVIKPGGYALYELDLSLRNREGTHPFESVVWDREDIVLQMMLRHFEHVVRIETEPQWKWILLQGKLAAAPAEAAGL